MCWICMAQDWNRCRALVNAVLKARVSQNAGNLTSWELVSLSRRALSYGVSKNIAQTWQWRSGVIIYLSTQCSSGQLGTLLYQCYTAFMETERYIYVPMSTAFTGTEGWCTGTEMMTQQRHVDCFSRGFCPTLAELVPPLMTFLQYITYKTSHLRDDY